VGSPGAGERLEGVLSGGPEEAAEVSVAVRLTSGGGDDPDVVDESTGLDSGPDDV